MTRFAGFDWQTNIALLGGFAAKEVAVVCIVKESGSWKWGVFSMAFNTLLAVSLSIVFYQTATWMMS